MKLLNLITPVVNEEIQQRINLHHKLYENIKIDSIYWEHILCKSLMVEHDDVQWNVGSHGVGTDIVCNGTNISCKGGTIKGVHKEVLTVSSHRTTQYKLLEEKLDYLRVPHEDVIYSLVQYNDGYRLTIFNPPNVDLFTWQEGSKKWRGIDNEGNILDIIKSMSDQYWMRLDYNKLEKITYDFTIS